MVFRFSIRKLDKKRVSEKKVSSPNSLALPDKYKAMPSSRKPITATIEYIRNLIKEKFISQSFLAALPVYTRGKNELPVTKIYSMVDATLSIAGFQFTSSAFVEDRFSRILGFPPSILIPRVTPSFT